MKKIKSILSIETLTALALFLMIVSLFIRSNIVMAEHYVNSSMEIGCKDIVYKLVALAYNTYYLDINQTIYIGELVDQKMNKVNITIMSDKNKYIKISIGNYSCEKEFNESLGSFSISSNIIKIIKKNDKVYFEGEA